MASIAMNFAKFEPKVPVQLDDPKTCPITCDYLSKCDGSNEGYPTCVAIKGQVFDVSSNPAYSPDGQYHIFAGKDASRALALTSLKQQDCTDQIDDLDEKQRQTLDDWYTYFSKRYNIIGQVQS